MSDTQPKLLVDRNIKKIASHLFFIDHKYVEFWMSIPSFPSEYYQIYNAGEKDGFYLFYLAACNVLDNMRYLTSTGVKTGFDFDLACKSIQMMEKRL